MFGKNKKKKVKKKPAGKTKIKKENILKDEVEILKSEVNYFKGLSLFLIVLLLIVFVAFGSLFGLMYLETRYISLQGEYILNKIVGPDWIQDVETQNFASLEEDAHQEPDDVETIHKLSLQEETAPSIDVSKFLSFSKYGFTVMFPNSWTYLDLPFQHQVHLFSDGKVHDDIQTQIGDLVINLTNENTYQGKYLSQVVAIADTYGFKYEVKQGNSENDVVVVPVKTGYIELHFRKTQNGAQVILDDLITAMIANFKLD